MSKKDPIKEFFAGGFGGSCLVLVGHPLDTIKVFVVPIFTYFNNENQKINQLILLG